MEKLSSGMRINRAGDDAAGLAISEKMRGQIRGLTQASSNAQDGISLIQTAEGALNETHAILQRMRELSVQASTDTNVGADRNEIQKEMNQLTSEINRIGNTTEFNTMKLVDGSRSIERESVGEVVGKTYDVAAAAGISDSGTRLEGLGDITLTATSDFNWADVDSTANKSTITIKKVDDKLTVSIDATGKTTADVLEVTDQFVTENADGSHSYNSHGVSFSVSAEDFAAMKDGADIIVDVGTNKLGAASAGDLVDATGTVSTESSWKTHDGVATIANGIIIDGDKIVEGAASVKIEGNAGATEFTVTISDAEGNALSTDKITKATAQTTLEYDNHGVKFDLASIAADKSGLEMTLDLEVTKGAVKSDDSLSFQVGANENQAMSLDINDMRASALGISSATGGAGYAEATDVTDGTDNTAVEYALDVSSHAAAAKSVTTINEAIEKVSAERSKLGAVQNRLEHTIKNLDTSAENLQAAEARIRDVDMAKEMMEQTKQNILAQASTAMLANANQSPQSVLQLLG